MKLNTYICKLCGSNKILREAWASWNDATQAFELADLRVTMKCIECDTKYHYLDQVEVTREVHTT